MDILYLSLQSSADWFTIPILSICAQTWAACSLRFTLLHHSISGGHRANSHSKVISGRHGVILKFTFPSHRDLKPTTLEPPGSDVLNLLCFWDSRKGRDVWLIWKRAGSKKHILSHSCSLLGTLVPWLPPAPSLGPSGETNKGIPRFESWQLNDLSLICKTSVEDLQLLYGVCSTLVTLCVFWLVMFVCTSLYACS